MKEKKKWFGSAPDKCAICQAEFKTSFVDGRVRGGRWALLCEDCHSHYGVGLGLGKGQKYDIKTLEKIGG